MKKKKRVWIVVIVAVIVVSGFIALMTYLNSVREYQRSVDNIVITDIDISKILDGTYTGECNVDFIYAKVEVIVKAGAIIKINLIEHKNGKGAPAEKITQDIIRKQKLDVDAISGATNSSKVIKKAIENALES